MLLYIPLSASPQILEKIGLVGLVGISSTLKGYTFGFNALIPTWVVAMVVTVLVSLVTKPVSEATLKRHFG